MSRCHCVFKVYPNRLFVAHFLHSKEFFQTPNDNSNMNNRAYLRALIFFSFFRFFLFLCVSLSLFQVEWIGETFVVVMNEAAQVQQLFEELTVPVGIEGAFCITIVVAAKQTLETNWHCNGVGGVGLSTGAREVSVGGR